jgi:hypothetical protein
MRLVCDSRDVFQLIEKDNNTKLQEMQVLRREVRSMTAFEICSLIIGALTLACAVGSLIIACLSYRKTYIKGNKEDK